jgi:hypothetical protein
VLTAGGPALHCTSELSDSTQACVVKGALPLIQQCLGSTQPSNKGATWILTALLGKAIPETGYTLSLGSMPRLTFNDKFSGLYHTVSQRTATRNKLVAPKLTTAPER